MHVRIPEVFEPLWAPARYKGCFGGRSSGKSQNFAHMAVVDCLTQKGTRGLCVREVQKTLKESAKRLIEDKIDQLGVARRFGVLKDEIKTPGGGLINFIGMQDHNAESMKSFEGLDWVWVEEAQTLSARSLQVLRPTIRKDTAEMRFSWNPRRKSDPIDLLLRGDHPPPGAVVVRANWSDNPFFPASMEMERLHDLANSPSYRHIWEGDYATVVEGTYFASQLQAAREEGRITQLSYDPILERRAYFDLGYNDATTIWIAQFKGQKIYVMDYIEGSGQELGYYINELRRRGHGDALCFLPHDGAHHHVGKSVDEHLKEADFRTRVVPNQGRGAAMLRVEAGRRILPRVWFNSPACDAGIDALGSYHERRDDKRSIGLGPEHDWCLAKDTLVLSPYGWREVQSLSVHDQVLTPTGPRRIVRAGVVRMTSEWVNLNGIKCTPEHRFFTNRGLVEAGDCRPLQDVFWTQDSLGLTILAFWSAALCFGLKTGIILATQEASRVSDARCSFIGWSMRLLMARYRRAMRSITSMMTRLITIPTTSKPCFVSTTDAVTSHSRDTFASVGSAERSSAAIKGLALGAVQNASEQIKPASPANAEPAYNLTVEIDECYFVRGNDGRAYLVSNSSDASDSFLMMCQLYEEPKAVLKPAAEIYRAGADSSTAWLAG